MQYTFACMYMYTYMYMYTPYFNISDHAYCVYLWAAYTKINLMIVVATMPFTLPKVEAYSHGVKPFCKCCIDKFVFVVSYAKPFHDCLIAFDSILYADQLATNLYQAVP